MPEKKILDVGCGEDWLTRRMTTIGKEVTGVDAIEALLVYAQSKTTGSETFFTMSYKDIVDGKHYPSRGCSCSADQIRTLKQDIKKFDLFAYLEIYEVYKECKLKNSIHYKAKTFASLHIENLGSSIFKIKSLPNLTQFSNINDVFIIDFNTDGNLDALIVNNLFVSEIETPRNDAEQVYFYLETV